MVLGYMAYFIPTRKGSERVRAKNTRPFCGISGGLLELKLLQLMGLKEADEIILSTNDDDSVKVAEGLDPSGKRIRVVMRPEYLCRSTTPVENLIKYVPSITDCEHICWVHTTSPFMGTEDFRKALEVYDAVLKENYDSLMSVTRLQQFLWSAEKGDLINCDRRNVLWPRTQDLTPLYEINNALFISSRANYLQYRDRIGLRPYLYELDRIRSIDIDREEDFFVAEAVYEKLFGRVKSETGHGKTNSDCLEE